MGKIPEVNSILHLITPNALPLVSKFIKGTNEGLNKLLTLLISRLLVLKVSKLKSR